LEKLQFGQLHSSDVGGTAALPGGSVAFSVSQTSHFSATAALTVWQAPHVHGTFTIGAVLRGLEHLLQLVLALKLWAWQKSQNQSPGSTFAVPEERTGMDGPFRGAWQEMQCSRFAKLWAPH
jgi:hypothetical protein